MHLPAFTVTATFQDRNQPALNEDAATLDDAAAVARRLRRTYAALKLVQIKNHSQRITDYYAPTPEGLSYQFSLNEIKL